MKKDSICIENPRLSARETEVLTLTAQGKKRGEIAAILSISEVTVKDYIRAACTKLGAINKIQASVLAILLGQIDPYRIVGLAPNSVKLTKKSTKTPPNGGCTWF